jgi:hypothetical protein
LLDDFNVVTNCRLSGSHSPEGIELVFSTLARFKSLESVEVSALAAPGERLPVFAAMKHVGQLRRLKLDGVRLGDDDVRELGGLAALEELDLRVASITDERLKRLGQLLPNCKIITGVWPHTEEDPGPEPPPSADAH